MLIHRFKNEYNNFRTSFNTGDGFMIFEVMLAIALVTITFLPIVEVVSGLRNISKTNTIQSAKGDSVANQLITKTIFSNSSTGILHIGRYRTPQFGDRVCAQFVNALGVTSSLNEQSLQSLVRIENFSALDLGVGTTSGITSLRILGSSVYAGINSASSTDFDLITIPIEDAEHSPDLKTSIKGINSGPGVAGLALTGTRVFAVNTSTKSAIQEFVISTNGEPVLVSEFMIPRTLENVVPIAKSVALTGKYVLVGLEKNTGPEVYIFDMENQRILFSLETGYGVNTIRVMNKYVYLVGPANPEMDVFEIVYSSGSENAPVHVSLQKVYSYDAPGSSGNGRSMDFLGNMITFGRSKGNNEFDILDRDQSLGSFKVQASVDSIVTGTSTALLITSDVLKEFQILGFMFNSQVPEHLRRIGYIDLPARGADFVCVGNSVLVASPDAQHALIRISVLPK